MLALTVLAQSVLLVVSLGGLLLAIGDIPSLLTTDNLKDEEPQ